jgi:hypothetical protein
MVSHWLALVLTARHVSLQLFTLQSAEIPWETWLLVPVCWFLLLSHPGPMDGVGREPLPLPQPPRSARPEA